jgi:hypothetical protein
MPQPEPTSRPTPEQAPALDEVSALAESLDPSDQMRLVARLLEFLSSRPRATIVDFVLQNVHTADDERGIRIDMPRTSTNPTLWNRLFDPTKTSDLYSAPRRFDLATIFVVTAAYSLLFGLMTPLDFGPVTKISVGLLVTIVAASQAFFHDKANPRGVSVVTGAVTLSAILIVLRIFVQNAIFGPLFIVVFFGLTLGAIAGYLCGVMVGGVFLVADKLRRKFDNRSKAESNDSSADDPE